MEASATRKKRANPQSSPTGSYMLKFLTVQHGLTAKPHMWQADSNMSPRIGNFTRWVICSESSRKLKLQTIAKSLFFTNLFDGKQAAGLVLLTSDRNLFRRLKITPRRPPRRCDQSTTQVGKSAGEVAHRSVFRVLLLCKIQGQSMHARTIRHGGETVNRREAMNLFETIREEDCRAPMPTHAPKVESLSSIRCQILKWTLPLGHAVRRSPGVRPRQPASRQVKTRDQ
jgi:hypothetical protein